MERYLNQATKTFFILFLTAVFVACAQPPREAQPAPPSPAPLPSSSDSIQPVGPAVEPSHDPAIALKEALARAKAAVESDLSGAHVALAASPAHAAASVAAPLPTPPPVAIAASALPPVAQPTLSQASTSGGARMALSGTQDASGYSSGGSATVNDAPYDLTFFKHYGVNPFIDTEDDHLSTFAMDVDTASYTVARRFVRDGHLPEPESVRVEEFVNFFRQGYQPPEEKAFAIHVEGSPSPFGGDAHWLMRVGLQGRELAPESRKDATLIFVIDVSGSMAREDRLGLVKKSLRLLVTQLRPTDEVGIVIYGSRGSVLLEPTRGSNRRKIMGAIGELQPQGSTNAAEGLLLAYEMAVGEVQPGRITRLILLSDGVANVGRTGPDSIMELIGAFVEEGVTLSAVGFGMGNYNDILMEQLADRGNGNYSYVDTLGQARRIFVENLTGTLQMIARDAKVQVVFNPDVVSRYRLLGYENRRVADQDFRNDSIDAGEVGAGHDVTALYELKLRKGAQGPLGTVYIRYEDSDSHEVTEISRDFRREELKTRFEDASPRFQLAAVVAEYAEVLRQSYWAQGSSLREVAAMAESVAELLPADNDAAEFAELVATAAQIDARPSLKR